MYRCTECQEEFKEKPKYCNCGNDEFEEIPDSPQQSHPFVQTPAAPEKSISKYSLNNLFPIVFFVICIILSISVWFIKVQPSKQEKAQTSEPAQSQNIPLDVESFWNNAATLADVQNSEPAKHAPNKQQQQNPQPTPKQQNPAPVKTVSSQKQSQPPKTSKTMQVHEQQKTSKTAKTTPQQPVTKQKINKPAQQTNPKPKLPDSVLNLGNSKPQTSWLQSKPASTPAPKPPQMSSSEFLKYKGEIRSALLAKLNVTAIQGSGECAVEFSLDSTGKLINRNFIYKSSNKSVNDEVYLMLMRLPYYKQPPRYYNGEKIRLKFYFNNGYYEITFI